MFFALHQVEELIQVRVVVPGERDADADPQADVQAGVDAPQALLEGAQLAPELVVDGLRAVDAHADVGEADFGHLLGQGAV